MKALVLTGKSQFQYTDVEKPSPASDEVLIRLKACSICGSDIHGCQGGSGRRIPPIIMGHEASGVIEQLGEQVTDHFIGEPVTFDSTEFCGSCDFCKKGMTNLCKNRKITGVSCTDYKKDGAMAEYITVKARTLYSIPPSVSFEEACLIEPLAVGLHAVRLSQPEKDYTAVIIGDGTIGLMVLQAAAAAGVGKIIIVGMQDYRLNAAKAFPQVYTVNSKKLNPLNTIMNLTNKEGADIIYDAVGTGKTMQDAFSYVKNGGKIICIGNASVTADFPLQECIVRQIQVLGSYSSAGEYSYGLQLMEQGLIDLTPFTKYTCPLSQGEKAFHLLMEGKSEILKVILKM